jgi:hypothetical protein
MMFSIKLDERCDNCDILCILRFFQLPTKKSREPFKHSTAMYMQVYEIFDTLSIYAYTL